MPTNVLIAGGGPAALEAALALHRLAGDRVSTILLAPDAEMTYRPLSVLAPFAAGEATTYPIERFARDAGFTHVRDRLESVDVAARTVTTVAGDRIGYDALILALGARPVEPEPRVIAFTGSARDQERLHGIVQDVEGGYVKSIAFAVPDGASWPLPLYELALMLAERAYSMGQKIDLSFTTPESSPLAVFGEEASRVVASLLADAGIDLRTGSSEAPQADRVISLPRLAGPSIPGLPDGFLEIDDHARVQGIPGVYAAGDMTAFPIKQGGIACQQSDAAAEHIAAAAGAPVEPQPFVPILRGMLLTERDATFLREDRGRGLWWPPAKIAGRELAGYLEQLDEDAGRPAGLPVAVTVRETGSGAVEVLSLS